MEDVFIKRDLPIIMDVYVLLPFKPVLTYTINVNVFCSYSLIYNICCATHVILSIFCLIWLKGRC